MPRKWTLRIEDGPALSAATFYPMKVLGAARNKLPPGQLIEFEHLDKSQAGRRHSILLPLPCRADGLTASFFGSVGLNVRLGQTVSPQDAVGATVKVRLEPAPDSDGCQAVAFQPVRKETQNEHAPQ
jgi:hypothetical protein